MATIRSLSEEDAEWLRKFIRQMRQNPRPQSRYREERELGQSPEVYVARTPSTGIAAVTPAVGTGTWDLVSFATCDVFRVIRDGARRQLRQVDGLTREVGQLSYNDIPGNIYVKIERDKFGTWWVSSTPAQLDPGPDTPPDPTDPGSTGTGTGTGPMFGCDFTEEELESIAGPGLAVDFTDDCPQLKVSTIPPSCLEVVVQETDLRCETTTGTGTDALGGSLNLYRRDVRINIKSGCPVISYGDWTFIRAVACCDPTCEQEASQELLWWCVDDGGGSEPQPTPGSACAGAPEFNLDQTYGPYTVSPLDDAASEMWWKFPTGLTGNYQARFIVSDVTLGNNTGIIVRFWPGNDCGSLGMGNSGNMDAIETVTLTGTITTNAWVNADFSAGTTPNPGSTITFTVILEATP